MLNESLNERDFETLDGQIATEIKGEVSEQEAYSALAIQESSSQFQTPASLKSKFLNTNRSDNKHLDNFNIII